MSETTYETKVLDNYEEHSTHEHHDKNCSLCYKKMRQITDGILLLAKQQKYEKHS